MRYEGDLNHKGSLDLSGTQITSLPDGLTVGGSLYLIGSSITSLPDNLTVGGYLNLIGTKITSLPDNLTVGGYLFLEGTPITSLPENLTVGGNLYLRGTSITSLPDGLTVGGNLDLRGTLITSLPDNLTVGGYLDLRGTKITSLPDNLTVGGYLDLRGSSITSLPDNLTVGGFLDLIGTKITSLPDNLTVECSLYLRGTNITSLPENITCGRIHFDGFLSGHEFIVADGIPGLIKSRNMVGDIEVISIKRPEFEDGNLVGSDTFYVARKNGTSAHGKTVRGAISDLRFKTSSRNKSEYEGIDLNEQRSIDDLVVMYRVITGACSFGVNQFIDEEGRKETYSVNEIIKLTEGRYGSEEFKDFFKG